MKPLLAITYVSVLFVAFARAHLQLLTNPLERTSSLQRAVDELYGGGNSKERTTFEGGGHYGGDVMSQWRPPKETTRMLAEAVVLRMETTPGVFEETAKLFFEALREGEGRRPPMTQEERVMRRAAEMNKKVQQNIGEALIGKLRFAVGWKDPGAIDHFTRRVYLDQRVRVCMTRIWWDVAVNYLVPRGLPEKELEGFYNSLQYIDPCTSNAPVLPKKRVHRATYKIRLGA